MDNAYDPNWLKAEMAKAGFGVTELAKLAGISRTQVQRIRGGMAPRMDTQAKLRAALATKAKPAKGRPARTQEATAA